MSDLEHELLEHAGALRRLARQLVGADGADDVVQESTVQALQRPPRDTTALGGWLRAVVRHHASKLRRTMRRRRQHEQWSMPPSAAPGPADLAEQREAVHRLHTALMSLPDPYQAVLLRRYFHDLTPTQIAAQGGAPLATIKSQLQRGLDLLRQQLDADRPTRTWRRQLAVAFAFPRRVPGTIAAGAGVLLMSSMLKLGGAAAAVAAALLTCALWPANELPTPVTTITFDAPAAGPAQAGGAAPAPPDGPGERVVATATPTPPAPVVVRLLDEFDRSPLPHFAVRAVADTQRPEVGHVFTSDERGELRLPGACRAQPTYLLPLDDVDAPWTDVPPQLLVATAGDTDQPTEIVFACGPTYTLLFEEPPPSGDLFAALTSGPNPRHAFDRDQGHVRAGAQPWLRLQAAETNPTRLGRGPWTLVISASQGNWYAHGVVTAVRGVQTTPVLLRAVTGGELLVTATVDGKPPTTSGLSASLYRLGPDDQATDVDFTKQLGEHGARVRFERLEPGRYRLFVRGPGDQLHREDLVIEANTTMTVRPDFHAATGTHALDVVARSETGQRNLFVLSFRADRVGGGSVASPRFLDRRADGAIVHRFDELADGEWDITLEPTPHLPPWQTLRQRVLANAGTVEFVCRDRDAPPATNLAIIVVEAATGKPIVGAGVTSFFDGQQFLTTTTDVDGRAYHGPYVAGKPLQLLARAAGCLPAFVTTVPTADAAAPLRIELAAGWGTMLLVVEPDPASFHGRPIADVRVSIDGRFVGVTDQHGLLLLSNASAPERIDLHRDGYEVHYGSIDAKTGAPVADEQSPFFVVMQRK